MLRDGLLSTVCLNVWSLAVGMSLFAHVVTKAEKGGSGYLFLTRKGAPM